MNEGVKNVHASSQVLGWYLPKTVDGLTVPNGRLVLPFMFAAPLVCSFLLPEKEFLRLWKLHVSAGGHGIISLRIRPHHRDFVSFCWQVPKSLILIGGGVIGLEMGSVWSRLGSDVTVIEFLDRVCPSMDQEITKAFTRVLKKQGLKFKFKTKV